jgi:hypothetical protein
MRARGKKKGTGNRERGTGNRERGTGNGEQEIGNGEQEGTGTKKIPPASPGGIKRNCRIERGNCIEGLMRIQGIAPRSNLYV